MACTGRCRHCSEGKHTLTGEHIDGEYAAEAVRDVCEHYCIQSLMTFGGEPLLYPKDVCGIHAAARDAGIPRRDMITNGYFTKDRAQIAEVAGMLAQSGVNHILLSADAFHQETIPLEPVLYFAECVMTEGIPIRMNPAWLVSRSDDNPYNVRTRELLFKFERIGIASADGNVIFPAGNAREYLGEYFDDSIEYTDPYEEDPLDIRTISVCPNGDVLNGNINQTRIMDILNSYSPPC